MNAEGETRTITQQYDLPHAPEKVWRALTDPSLVAEWLMANDLVPTVGHSFTFRSEPMAGWDGIVKSEVLAVDAPRLLRYAWRSGFGAKSLDTVVTWTLEPNGTGGTKLTLEHSGFKPGDGFFEGGADKGWRWMLSTRLPEVLARI